MLVQSCKRILIYKNNRPSVTESYFLWKGTEEMLLDQRWFEASIKRYYHKNQYQNRAYCAVNIFMYHTEFLKDAK